MFYHFVVWLSKMFQHMLLLFLKTPWTLYFFYLNYNLPFTFETKLPDCFQECKKEWHRCIKTGKLIYTRENDYIEITQSYLSLHQFRRNLHCTVKRKSDGTLFWSKRPKRLILLCYNYILMVADIISLVYEITVGCLFKIKFELF